MPLIQRIITIPDLNNYVPEYNEDGTEKHITCDGARFHVVSFSQKGIRCSETRCELNRVYGIEGR